MKQLTFLFALVLLFGGCLAPEAADFLVGQNITGTELQLYTPEVGIHPDVSVLEDPNNPFDRPLDGDTKWRVNDFGGAAAAFYGWATMLVYQPTGEHQYYVGVNLRELHRAGLEGEVDRETLRLHGVAAFQAVLDHFPESVSFDPSGTWSFRLAPLAYDGIIALGGTPEGGWVEVSTPDGGRDVVQGSGEGTP